jgi:hypothetical protein
MGAVGGDHHVGADGGAVLGGEHHPVGGLPHAGGACAEAHRFGAEGGDDLVEQELLQLGARHGQGPLADPVVKVAEGKVEQRAALVIGVGHAFHVAADSGDLPAEAEQVEDLDAVRPQRDTGADGPEDAGLFDQHRPVTETVQAQGSAEAPDAAPDDGHPQLFHRRSRMVGPSLVYVSPG